MSVQRLKNVLVEAALAGESTASLRAIASAVAELHRSQGLISPTVSGGGLDRLLKPFEVSLGTPQAQINPVTAANMQSLALVIGTDLRTERAVVMTMFGTVIAGRNEHVAARRLCDAQENYDMDKGEEFVGGFAFNIQRQKQDRVGSGCKPRAAPGPFTRRLKKWIKTMGLVRHPQCQKRANGTGDCRFCPPLFPRYLDGRKEEDGSIAPVTSQMVGEGVKAAMRAIGVDAARMSGRSMRRGGITAGTMANVPEEVLFLQSGHGQKKAGRLYMHDQSAERLYATSKALGMGQ